MKKTILLFVVCLFGFLPSLEAAQWYRGVTHAHSNWSDGNVTLEEAASWYQFHGYHFATISDHRILQTDPNRWVDVSQEKVDELDAKFGKGWTDTRTVDGKLQMRLKTIGEAEKKFNEPGRFLLIPGLELTAHTVEGDKALHMNPLNVTKTIPYPDDPTLAGTIRKAIAATREHGQAEKRPTLLIVNHPTSYYYDIEPKALIDVDEVEFYEFFNPDFQLRTTYTLNDEQFWTRENYWDIVSAFRTVAGKKFVYGVGADDAHNYLTLEKLTWIPGVTWICVRAEELTADALFQAMRKGDFYISTGMELDNIRFEDSTKTLTVDVKPEEGVKYRIDFIGTKKNFDRMEEPFVLEQTATNPTRAGFTYRFEDFGVTLKSVEGTTASYTMKDDDLYVRAKVTSDRPIRVPNEYEPPTETAWTQPYR